MPLFRLHTSQLKETIQDNNPQTPIRLGAIGESECFFLRSMRGWSTGHDGLNEVWNDHARRFGAADGRLLLHLFSACYGEIRLAAKHPIRHHPPCCPYLAPDELRLTALFCSAALGQTENAQFVAHLLFSREALPAVLDAASRLARAYAARGLPVSPSSPLARYGESAAGTA